jgi:hypothetical protein
MPSALPTSCRDVCIMNGNKALKFSTEGIGQLYAPTFEKAFDRRDHRFPNGKRGKTLLMVADFGGQHKGQQFESFSFLFLDIEQNAHWFSWQKKFRSSHDIHRRRMAYKALNDVRRGRALIPFLDMANRINGCLITFAISRNSASLFEESSDESLRLLDIWKPKIKERLLRIVHLSAYFASALSCPRQDVLWIVDEDSIAANVEQLTRLTEAFARVMSHYVDHDLGHLRCGTSRSDNGSLDLEDLLSVPDLIAGAVSDVATEMISQGCFPRKGLLVPLPDQPTWKTRLILSWLAYSTAPLRRETFILEPYVKKPGSRLTHCKFNADIGGPNFLTQ